MLYSPPDFPVRATSASCWVHPTAFLGILGAMAELKIKILPGRPDIPLPSYKSMQAAALDLASAEARLIKPGERALIGTGLAMAIPWGYEGQVRPRSGLALKHGVTVLNSPGTIDADYRGELKVMLINHGNLAYRVEVGDRVAQFLMAPVQRAMVEVVDDLGSTARGDGGFGHTGR